MIVPLVQLMGILFVIFYIYSVIGMMMFGGTQLSDFPSIYRVSETPHGYHFQNFNDLISAFVTLFTIMVINNWFVVVEMFVSSNTANFIWYRAYFITFYYLSVLIGMNILVAYTIDMYASVERLDEERQRTIKLVKKEIAEEAEKI